MAGDLWVIGDMYPPTFPHRGWGEEVLTADVFSQEFYTLKTVLWLCWLWAAVLWTINCSTLMKIHKDNDCCWWWHWWGCLVVAELISLSNKILIIFMMMRKMTLSRMNVFIRWHRAWKAVDDEAMSRMKSYEKVWMMMKMVGMSRMKSCGKWHTW